MRLELNGKIALIAGGSKGIGFACAEALRAEGANVSIVSRTKHNIDSALERLPGVTGFAADLTSAEAAGELVNKVEAQVGGLNILVNCAGAAQRTPPHELTPEHWRAAMNAKYFSYINIIDPVVKRMAERRSGVIVNIIGAGGKVASPVHLPGGAANAALALATVGLANVYAGSGVRVIGISPGATDTERLAEGLRAEAALGSTSTLSATTELIARIPVGRIAKPEEIANVVAFLVSPKASYVTGVVITMDGAQTPTVV